MAKNNYKVGILGGMGPMTGVELQKLIIENTPAKKDQDHLQVICFTNSKIPDRTKSLAENSGNAFLAEVLQSIKVLEKVGVDCILLPCNTAHARFIDIQKATKVPVINMVDVALKKVKKSGAKTFGVLATNGAITSRVFEEDKNLQIVFPDARMQKEVMNIIYQVKSGKYTDKKIVVALNNFVKKLQKRGAQKVILGCTELSLYFPLLKNKNIIDPLLELAREAIEKARV